MIKIVSQTGKGNRPSKIQIIEVSGKGSGASQTRHIHLDRSSGEYHHQRNGIMGSTLRYNFDRGRVTRA